MSEFDLNKAIMKFAQQFAEMMSNDDNDEELADPSKWVKHEDYEKNIKRALDHLCYTFNARYIDLKSVTTGKLKSSEKATEFFEKGNKQFKKENSWKDSLELYTRGVMHAPPNSNELARAYANRSAALCDGGLYDDAILDIGRALEIGYPDDLKPKLYTRRAMCSVKLNETVNPDAEKDLNDARHLLAKLNSDDAVNEIINKKLATISSMKAPYEKIDYNRFLPKIVEENSKLKGVTDAVELQYSEKYGRQVVATRNIRAGEAIYVHKPYASIIESTVAHKYCWHCSKRVWAGVPCHQCVSVIYCNEKCRDEAWQEYHDVECLIIPQLIRSEIVGKLGTPGLLALKITAKVFKEAGSLEKLKEKIDELNTKQDDIKKCFSGDVFDNMKYEAIYSLSRNGFVRDMSPFSVLILNSIAANTEIFGKKYVEIDKLEKNEWIIFMGALIMRHLDICISNSKKEFMKDENRNKIIRGTELFPFFSLFNNNCDPNVIVYNSANVSAMITLQQIKKGEQVFISYQNPYWDEPTRERKASLLKYFNFNCDCTACKKEWDVQSINSFPSRKVKGLPSSLKKKLAALRDKPKFVPSLTSIGAMLNYEKISVNMELMNLHQKYMKYPTREMMELKLATMIHYENSTY
ncbi:hypothetical protein PV326_007325 [Microctonus aethiopoides]|nr:hypothetical protein PV326_007325 [Microctonus aethiopoides]